MAGKGRGGRGFPELHRVETPRVWYSDPSTRLGDTVAGQHLAESGGDEDRGCWCPKVKESCPGPRKRKYRTRSPFPTSCSSTQSVAKELWRRGLGNGAPPFLLTRAPSQPPGLLRRISSPRALMLASPPAPAGDRAVCHLLGTRAGRPPSAQASGHQATTRGCAEVSAPGGARRGTGSTDPGAPIAEERGPGRSELEAGG